MYNHKFKVGDVVHLNSSPEVGMTISKIMNNNQVIVVYFIRGNRKVDNFSSEMLTLYKS
ncbi:MAG: hypothetical protein PQ275_08950 [Elizabethkingia anophelis]|nr:MAG: hypothetical protein PQ275_08950 [Elizabethkingia anophelis]